MKRTIRNVFPLWLMAISLLLLMVIQGLWLRTEYNNAVSSFSRETNFIFRSTLHQMAENIFINNMGNLKAENENPDLMESGQKFSFTMQDNIREISVIRLTDNMTENPENDTLITNRVTIALNNPENPEDSIKIVRNVTSSPQDIRWFFTGEMTGYNHDSIAKNYRRNLNPTYARLPITVLEKEFTFMPQRQSQRVRTDSLPFTTSFYPFARKMYAAEFQGAQMLIMKKLLPQAGFSLFTTGLIFFSFLLVYRSLRTQQKLIEQKDNFVSNITHELKTPVASVGVAIEAIKNFDVLKNKERTLEYLDQAGKELARLTILTDKILKTSVLDYSNEISNNQEVIDLEKVTCDVIDSFKLLLDKQGFELDFETTGNTHIKGNKEHVTQAIYNLIDNAVKYAYQGQYLRIGIGELPDGVVMEVEDRGPGISAEHRKKIFEKFYRIPTGNIHNIKGYGLGLNYVEGVVKQHNGKLNLESTPGKCTKFILKFNKP